MDTITKYASIGLGAIAVILLIYCQLLKNDRDNALSKVDRLQVVLTSLHHVARRVVVMNTLANVLTGISIHRVDQAVSVAMVTTGAS